MPDRHREKPLSLRLGPQRQRIEDYAREQGRPVRSVIATAVRAWLDEAEALLGVGTGREKTMADDGLTLVPGTWRSVYEYESSSWGEVLTDEREVTLGTSSHWVWVTSLPGSPSLLGIELTIKGRILTGTWTEETDPDGYYAGTTFRGAVQFIVSEDGRSMSGRWVGHSRDMAQVNTGTWTLTSADEAEALLDADGRRERLELVVADLQSGKVQPVDHETARDRIDKHAEGENA